MKAVLFSMLLLSASVDDAWLSPGAGTDERALAAQDNDYIRLRGTEPSGSIREPLSPIEVVVPHSGNTLLGAIEERCFRSCVSLSQGSEPVYVLMSLRR
jgi:hypothetical protein